MRDKKRQKRKGKQKEVKSCIRIQVVFKALKVYRTR